MRFRPCIDIHNGKVKQIVGGSLKDENDQAVENFSAEQDADYFAELYQDGLKGGHVILLNPVSSEYYEATKKQALKALAGYPGGLQIGGGITAENAGDYIQAGASHVIVSLCVSEWRVPLGQYEEAKRSGRQRTCGRDLSCRKKDGDYYIVTNRWQTFTNVRLDGKVLDEISVYCDGFLIHGVRRGREKLPVWRRNWYVYSQKKSRIPTTYAGGIGSLKDLEHFKNIQRESWILLSEAHWICLEEPFHMH